MGLYHHAHLTVFLKSKLLRFDVRPSALDQQFTSCPSLG
jgi:hypothetical protein